MTNQKSEFAINLALVAASSLISLLVVNQIIVFASNNNSQKIGFPRKMLQYMKRVARWSYPDFNNKNTNKATIFIVGDSYAEGAGDAFRTNKYKYSIGHFLDEKWRRGKNIELVANGGSDLPKQFHALSRMLNGNLKPLAHPPQPTQELNIISFFYEGNDLENTVISKGLPFQRAQDTIGLYFPIIHTLRTARVKLIYRFYPPQPAVQPKNKICISNNCRNMPPFQTAAAGLSFAQINNEIDYLKDSIDNFLLKHPDTNMCLVYIPSPATIYSPDKVFYYQDYFGDYRKPTTLKTSSKANNAKSLLMRKLLKTYLSSRSIAFVDPTLTLQNEAKKKFIHGILDPKHFNVFGYKLIAMEAVRGCFSGN